MNESLFNSLISLWLIGGAIQSVTLYAVLKLVITNKPMLQKREEPTDAQ